MKLSIITPFYNTDKNLFGHLLESIINQSDMRFEWIIVNDCSDESHENELKKSMYNCGIKNYVLIKNDKNYGAAISRNRGIQASSGDYIVFVDSDDYIDNDFVRIIYECIDNNHADIIFFDYIRKTSKKEIKCKTLNIQPNQPIQRDAVLLNMTTNVCGKVIKASIINKDDSVLFPDLKRYEDWVFMTSAVCFASSYYYLEGKYLYYYYDNNMSVVHKYNMDGCDYARKAFEIIQNKVSDNTILEYLFVREVIYTSIRDKILRLNRNDFNVQMKSITQEYPNWRKHIKGMLLGKKQKIILSLYANNMYYTEKMLVKFASK